MDEKPKTYFARQRESKRRLEILLPIIFTLGVFICYGADLVYFEKIELWQAIRQVSLDALNLFIVTLVSLPLVFGFFFVGRLINKSRSRK